MEMKELIGELGGQAQFARRFGIPYRSVQNWYRGERKPPCYVHHMLEQLAQKTEENRITQNKNTEAYQEIEDLNQENEALRQKLAETEAALEWVEYERELYKAESDNIEKERRALHELLYRK